MQFVVPQFIEDHFVTLHIPLGRDAHEQHKIFPFHLGIHSGLLGHFFIVLRARA
jgi:hypothetical protein